MLARIDGYDPEDAPGPDIPCIQKGCGKLSGHRGRHTDGTLPGHVTAARVEDAPGGPWKYKVNADGVYVIWSQLGDKDILEVKSEARAIAVRDALNGLKGGGETDDIT